MTTTTTSTRCRTAAETLDTTGWTAAEIHQVAFVDVVLRRAEHAAADYAHSKRLAWRAAEQYGPASAEYAHAEALVVDVARCVWSDHEVAAVRAARDALVEVTEEATYRREKSA